MATTDKHIQAFLAGRVAGAPLIAFITPDPAVAMQATLKASKPVPAFLWDSVRGLRALNPEAEEAIGLMCTSPSGAQSDPATLTNWTGFVMEFAARLPEDGLLYCFGVGRFLADTSAEGSISVQALWNLRDPFKGSGRTIILMGQSLRVPPELTNDVLVIDEPLPGEAELAAVVRDLVKANDVKCDETEQAKAVDALRGLAHFPAEQAVAMSVRSTKDGWTLDHDMLWERKRKLVEATPGLSVWRGGERFADVGGNAQIKKFLTLLKDGRDAFKVVVFIDEIDKQASGATSGDTSGTSQAQNAALLTYMEDKNVQGLRFLGPPGAGKSAISKAIGGEAGVLTLMVNLGTAKGQYVGQSEAQMDALLKVVDAVGGDNALWVATCNRDTGLSPELRRRFPTVFFFDLLTPEERDMVWPIYYRKYDLGTEKKNPRPDDAGWTGAEIRQAARFAYKLRIPLVETAQFIVPVSVANAEEIRALRAQADRKFLSAAHPGLYIKPSEIEAPTATRRLAKEA